MSGERPFSAAERARLWEEAGEEIYDLLVVGGGITGAGVAREAAGRGLRVLLVEAGDIAQGTSSRSSRLIHGGLRYLETFDFALVFEALRERRRLLDAAPHLVRPLPFLFPVYRGDDTGLAKLAAGMWLYEGLALFRSPRRHRILGRQGVRDAEPELRADGLVGGAIYHDAQVDDSRLTVAVARAAHEAGADLLTYTRATDFLFSRGEPSTVGVRDERSGETGRVRARLVLNATGPWSDAVRRLADPAVRPRLRTTKGVHLLVRRARLANRNAIIFRSAVDARVMFLLPWGEFTYVGTTDTPFVGDPADVRAEPEDIRYLLDSANALVPSARLGTADVVSTWAGVRPLLSPAGGDRITASATSREHAIWRDSSGMLNVAGGKLTTFRSMAAEVADEASRILSTEFAVESGRYYTEYVPLPGAPAEGVARLQETLLPRAAAANVDVETLRHLIGRFGTDTESIIEMIEARPELGNRIATGTRYVLAEAVFAVRFEMAVGLEDILRRRLHLFYEEEDGGGSAAERVARLVGVEDALAWDGERMEQEARRYVAEVARTRAGLTPPAAPRTTG